MKLRVLGQVLMAAGLVLSAGTAVAADKHAANPQSVNLSDSDLANKIRHELVMYPRFTIWDDINFRVVNKEVQIWGDVTQPFKKSEMEHIVRDVPGVAAVTSDIKVLPLSDFDNRLRLQVARAIYNDPTFTQYAMMAVPPVHIIVDNGHVTLTGSVANDFEKTMAGMRARGVGLSFGVVNNLQVEHPTKKS